nr:phytolongin Phyl1.1 isoform X1 [Ipomoea batatas]
MAKKRLDSDSWISGFKSSFEAEAHWREELQSVENSPGKALLWMRFGRGDCSRGKSPPILKIMRDFIVGFEDLAEGLFWYFWDVFEFAADEFLLFCLVFASLAEEFFARLLSQILIA